MKDDILGDMKQHESYAMMGFYRTHGHDTTLFGSSIKHNDTIMMQLKTGKHSRSLNNDWYFGDKLIVEVELSSTQFAEMITSLNQGDGVPVTLRYCLQGDLKKIEDPPFIPRGELHREEFKKSITEVPGDTQNLIKDLQEIFRTKKTLTKKEQEEVLRTLNKISMNIGCNQEFQVDQFNEQMDKTVQEAKGEIESFFQNKMLQIANQVVVENPEKLIEGAKRPIMLDEDN